MVQDKYIVSIKVK